jgi:hypothetical protein
MPASAAVGGMGTVRSSALPVGLTMGLIIAVVGFTSGNSGLVGLGVVLVLVGFFSRKKKA